ncbi:MAG: SAM-dependent methyltransferase [Streptomycetales bacterium]
MGRRPGPNRCQRTGSRGSGMTGEGLLPRRIDTSRPSQARMYDYWLSGKDNYAVDREAAARVREVFPQVARLARANRQFLERAVRYCAGQGIDQFIDIGTGLPHPPNVPDIAREVNPAARVVGVDNDSVVLAHHRALVAVEAGITTVDGDVRDPDGILADPELTALIDLDRPVAVLLVAILHSVRDDEGPAGTIARLTEAMAPGSYLVIAAATSTGAPAETLTRIEEVYAEATTPAVFRPEHQLRTWLEPLHLVAPGLVDVQRWRPDTRQRRTSVRILGGVAHKRSANWPTSTPGAA